MILPGVMCGMFAPRPTPNRHDVESQTRSRRDQAIMHRHNCPRINARTEVEAYPLINSATATLLNVAMPHPGLLPHHPTQHPPRASALPRFAAPFVAPKLSDSPPSDHLRHVKINAAPNHRQRRLAGGRPAPLPHGFAAGSVRIARAVVSPLATIYPEGARPRPRRSPAPGDSPARSLTAPSPPPPAPADARDCLSRALARRRARRTLRALLARSAPPHRPPGLQPDDWYLR